MLPRSVIIPTTQQRRPSDSSSALPLRTIKHWAMWIQVQCRWPRMSVEASQHHQGKLTPLRLKTSSCLSSAEGNLQQMWLQTAELPAGLGPWIRPILRLPLWPLSHCLSPPSRQEKTRPRLLLDPVFTACRSCLARPTETLHTLTVLLWKRLGAHWTLALWPSCKGVCKCNGIKDLRKIGN